MSELRGLVTAFQLADSAFPAGGFAFSTGLEGLSGDDVVRDASDVQLAIEKQLRSRWQTVDRVVLRLAFSAMNISDLISLDRFVESASVIEVSRSGSKRAGRALLNIGSGLNFNTADAYRAAIENDAGLGHLPIAQAVVFRDAELDLSTAELLSGWLLITGMASAAIRLNIVGHLGAQRLIASVGTVLVGLLESTTASQSVDDVHSFTPFTDIAQARNTSRHVRLFIT